jgi:hypothetical protein
VIEIRGERLIDLEENPHLAERLLDFQYYWESKAQPFDWKFTRQDLKELLRKFDQRTLLTATA